MFKVLLVLLVDLVIKEMKVHKVLLVHKDIKVFKVLLVLVVLLVFHLVLYYYGQVQQMQFQVVGHCVMVLMVHLI